MLLTFRWKVSPAIYLQLFPSEYVSFDDDHHSMNGKGVLYRTIFRQQLNFFNYCTVLLPYKEYELCLINAEISPSNIISFTDHMFVISSSKFLELFFFVQGPLYDWVHLLIASVDALFLKRSFLLGTMHKSCT